MTSQGQRDLDRIAGQVGLLQDELESCLNMCVSLLTTGLDCQKGMSQSFMCIVLYCWPVQNKFHIVMILAPK